MDKIKISTAQFENRSGDKEYNLSRIKTLARESALQGSHAIAFHECSVTGYSFARHLTLEEMTGLAEFIPDGPSIRRLTEIASEYNIFILAGLFEKDHENKLYKAYVCVGKKGLVAKFRKLHPFISPYLTPGDSFCIFDLHGWKCGILICYDNNIIENVRATTLLGADIIFMPHVTMCTPSTRPGAGFVDPLLWEKRETDPTSLRLEFDGMKGRGWLMKWLPSRAYDNGIYVIFSNPVGMDDDQLKNGLAMIIDPFGDIIAECRTLGDDFVSATLTPEKIEQSGGSRYIRARRPDLYKDIIGQDHIPEQKIIWLDFEDSKRKD
jgi:predicted amidohydrolase